MATSTKEHNVPASRSATEVPTGQAPASPRAPTTKSIFEHFREYERERPGVVAFWCLGLGFALGWKLKLW